MEIYFENLVEKFLLNIEICFEISNFLTLCFLFRLCSSSYSGWLAGVTFCFGSRCFGCSLWRINCFVDHHNYHEDWAKPLTLVILEQLKCCLISFDHIHAFLNLIVFPNLIRVVFFETMSCVLDRFWTFWCHIFIELE